MKVNLEKLPFFFYLFTSFCGVGSILFKSFFPLFSYFKRLFMGLKDQFSGFKGGGNRTLQGCNKFDLKYPQQLRESKFKPQTNLI